jgi:hypothetical protein
MVSPGVNCSHGPSHHTDNGCRVRVAARPLSLLHTSLLAVTSTLYNASCGDSGRHQIDPFKQHEQSAPPLCGHGGFRHPQRIQGLCGVPHRHLNLAHEETLLLNSSAGNPFGRHQCCGPSGCWLCGGSASRRPKISKGRRTLVVGFRPQAVGHAAPLKISSAVGYPCGHSSVSFCRFCSCSCSCL